MEQRLAHPGVCEFDVVVSEQNREAPHGGDTRRQRVKELPLTREHVPELGHSRAFVRGPRLPRLLGQEVDEVAINHELNLLAVRGSVGCQLLEEIDEVLWVA